jgi:hypothetical protein
MTPKIRNARADEFDFAFEVKRDAMEPHIKAKWGWDEGFQINCAALVSDSTRRRDLWLDQDR